MPWKDLLLIFGQIALRTVIPLPIIVYRRSAFQGDAGGLGQVVMLVLKSVLVAGVGLGIIGLSVRAGNDPFGGSSRPPTTLERGLAARGHGTTGGPRSAALPWRQLPVEGRVPGDAAELTAMRLQDLFTALVLYQNTHGLAAPASLDELANAMGWTDPLASPFDPAAKEPGYAFEPANASAPPFRVVFYDAAELRLTGQTHVIYRPGRRIVLLTRDELAAEPGVVLP